MAQYASKTTVATSASVEDIRRTVERYGASAFGYLTESSPQVSRAAVTFVAHGRQVRIVVDMPDRQDREFTHTPSRGAPRDSSAAHAAWEQACRQRWRAVALLVKALLEAVESGIVTFSEAFLPFTIVPGTNETVAERIGAELEQALAIGGTPRLMLEAARD